MEFKDCRSIYMDYAATTPIDPRVLDKMLPYMTKEGEFGNPASSSHDYGRKARVAVEKAREEVAKLVNANAKEIVWTSGATEADNLAIKGVAHYYSEKGKHIITSKIEHKAVLDSCRQLEQEGFEVSYLNPGRNGLINLAELEAAIRDDTILISIMHVNNELGVIQDITSIGEIARSKEIIFHVDAAQSVGKIDIDLSKLKVDLMSISGHKIYGPKGIGAMYISRKPRIRLEAQMHGGGHEQGMRSGTLPTHQIVGLGEACRIARSDMTEEREMISRLRGKLLDKISGVEGVSVNGDLDRAIPNILNVSFDFINGEALFLLFDGFAISSGSACNSASLEPSYVLRAIGCSDEIAHSSIRLSLGRFTTEKEVESVVQCILKAKNNVDALQEEHSIV